MSRIASSKTSSIPKPARSLVRTAAGLDVILTKVYGRKEPEVEEDPVDTLVETILSQNTTDRNSHKAFQVLKQEYPKWEHVLGEDSAKIARLIRSGGLAEIKARRILEALRFIKNEHGSLSLDFLRRMKPAEADAWLAQMKGVGPKTRGIVLLFALRMPAFPVDTHIHRVTKRLGLIGQKTSREMAQEELALLVPTKEFYNFHINLIEHGRAVCQARKPKCSICDVRRLCDYYRRVARGRS